MQFVSPILRSRNLSMGTFSDRNITRRVFAYGIYFRSLKCLQVWNICFHPGMYLKSFSFSDVCFGNQMCCLNDALKMVLIGESFSVSAKHEICLRIGRENEGRGDSWKHI